MLSEIYNWFTEGFDTADLKDAKACSLSLTARPMNFALSGRKPLALCVKRRQK